jgi:ketosteroid isomerase-like protein
MDDTIVSDKSWEEIDRRLTAIEDREQIRTLLYRYARGVDRAEVARTHDLYWEDGILAFGPQPIVAHENMEAMTREHAARVLDATHHMFGNILIDLRGDHAFVESYCVAHHRTFPDRESNERAIGEEWTDAQDSPDGVNELVIGFRYLDRFEKRGGEWRVAHRRFVFDWSRAAPYAGLERGGLWDGTPYRGARHPEDQVYDWGAVGPGCILSLR